MISTTGENLADAIRGAVEANPDSLGGRKLKRFTRDSREIDAIRSVAETQLAILDSRRLVASMESDDNPLSLADLGTSPVTIYLVLPLDRLETHGRWLRLIITMAIRAIAKLDRLPPAPVYFLLDEAGTIGPLRMVEQAVGLMAGVGIRIGLYLQDLVQLQKDYPRSWETFISNASVIQALKVSDRSTSEYLSALMGTTTRKRITGETMQLRQGVRKSPFERKRPDPNVTTAGDQFLARPLMLPQEIRDNIGDEVLVILPGVGNYLLNRLPYFAPDSIWKGLYRSPPWFAAANAAAVAAPPPAPPPPRPAPVSPGKALDDAAAKAVSWLGDKLRQSRPPR